jgi:hypothetical protein
MKDSIVTDLCMCLLGLCVLCVLVCLGSIRLSWMTADLRARREARRQTRLIMKSR